MGRVHSYKSGEVEVRFDTSRCIHSAECVRGLPEVFDTKRTPWIEPGRAEAERVKEAVLRCPTGALTFHRGGVEEDLAGPSQVRVQPDGPLLLRGDFRLPQPPEGGSPSRMALCRCGASSRKPFCDGSHRGCAFRDPGAVAGNPEGELEGGSVSVQPAHDGPLLLDGPFALVDGEGRVAAHPGRCALCRCGASATKPFCDGSHRRVGFKAE